MRIVSTNYICDLCGGEHLGKGSLWTFEATVSPIEEGDPHYYLVSNYHGPIKMELCSLCIEKVLRPVLTKAREQGRGHSLAHQLLREP